MFELSLFLLQTEVLIEPKNIPNASPTTHLGLTFLIEKLQKLNRPYFYHNGTGMSGKLTQVAVFWTDHNLQLAIRFRKSKD